jgi:hypothetical protein
VLYRYSTAFVYEAASYTTQTVEIDLRCNDESTSVQLTSTHAITTTATRLVLAVVASGAVQFLL